MKYIILFFLFGFSLVAKSQIYTPQKGTQFTYVKVDSGFAVAFRDTVLGRGTTRPGSIVCRPADSLFYGWNGRKWGLLYDTLRHGNLKVDSVTVHGDTLLYWINGSGTGYVLNYNLQKSTDFGNTTTNSIVAYRYYVKSTTDSVLVLYEDEIGQGAIDFRQSGFYGTLTPEDLSAQRVWQLPNKTGVIALTSDIGGSSWNYNGNTVGSVKKLGTLDNYNLPFIIGNSQKAVLTTAGYLGVGVSSPSYTIDVNGTAAIHNIPFSSNYTDSMLTVDATTGQLKKGAAAWSLSGNAGTTSLNFLGTTDNAPLRFKLKNIQVLKFDTSNNYIAIGDSAMPFYTPITNIVPNLAIGRHAMFNITTGYGNYAIGDEALYVLTTQRGNIALGHQAGQTAAGLYGTYLGTHSGQNNTVGDYNVGVGYYSVFAASGSNNTGIGTRTLQSSGKNETALGFWARNGNSATGFNGVNSTAIGYMALTNIGNDTCVTGIGDSTFASDGLNNATAVGSHAAVTANNTMTLGSINGTNGATADTKVGIGTTAADSLLTVTKGVYFKRGVRFSGLPTGAGVKSLRIDASGVVSMADTTTGGGGGGTNYWTNSSSNTYLNTGTKLGINVSAPVSTLDVLSTTAQLRLSYDASHSISFGVDANRNLKVGDVAEYPNNVIKRLEFQYYSGAYSTDGLYLHEVGNGYSTVLHSLASGNLYLTDAAGAAVGITVGSVGNPIDGTKNLAAASAGWYIDGQGALTIGGTAPDASAILDLQSTAKGLGIMVMTTTQKNAISSPREGLLIYDTTLHKLCIRVASAWETVTSL